MGLMRNRLSPKRVRLTKDRPLIDRTGVVKCPFCVDTYPSGIALNRHVKKIHPQAIV
jgi:hypothetical protein